MPTTLTPVKKKYHLLNVIRIIAAFFVVAIHVHFPGTFGEAVIGFARFAVPFFFMASGFFSYYGDNTSTPPRKIVRKIKHVTIIFLGSSLLYIVYKCLGGIKEGLSSLFTPVTKIFVDLLMFNQPSWSEHLWFLPALIYTYIVFFVFEKLKITKKMYILIPVLFLAGVALKEISTLNIIPLEIICNGYFCRNFLFIGIPFFLLGHYIRANEEKIVNKFSDTVLVIMFVLGSAEAIALNLWYLSKSVYIGSFVAVFALFVFTIKNEDKIRNSSLALKVALLGEKYSLYIYILHILVRNVVIKATELLPILKSPYEALTPIMPILIFIATLIVSIIYVYIKTIIKTKITAKQT